MTLAILMCGVLTVLCVVIAVLLFRGADNLLGEVEPRVAWDSSPTVAESPTASSAPKATPTSISAPSLTRLHLVSNSGRPLGSVEVPAKQRRMNFLYRVGKAKELSVFCASQKLANGDWEYRRVGVEKE
jgi:hypothetical protein